MDKNVIKLLQRNDQKPIKITDKNKNYVYNFFLTDTDTMFGETSTIEFTAQDVSALFIM
jgi:hypothetical protein